MNVEPSRELESASHGELEEALGQVRTLEDVEQIRARGWQDDGGEGGRWPPAAQDLVAKVVAW